MSRWRQYNYVADILPVLQ